MSPGKKATPVTAAELIGTADFDGALAFEGLKIKQTVYDDAVALKEAVDAGRFGKVILKKENGKGGQPEYTVVEGARFSNLDLKWYDADGNIHPAYNQLAGKQWAFGLKLKEVDRLGNQQEVECQFDMPFAVGEVFPVDVHNFELELEWNCQEAIKGYGAKDKEYMDYIRKYHRVLRGETHHIFAGIRSEISRDYKAHFILTSTLGIFDDILDEAGIKLNIPFKESSKMMRHFGDILMGRESKFESDDEKLVDVVDRLDKFIYYSRDAALHERTEEEAQYFLEQYAAYFEAVAWEISQECMEYLRKYVPKTTEKRYAKDSMDQVLGEWLWILHGEMAAVEGFVVAKRIKLREELRNSFLIKGILKHGAEHISKVNDILSFRKECEQGLLANIVCLYHKNLQMPLNEAMQAAVDKANVSIASILEIEKLLLDLYGPDEQLKEFLHCVKVGTIGHIMWSFYITRYHPDIVVDCVVKV